MNVMHAFTLYTPDGRVLEEHDGPVLVTASSRGYCNIVNALLDAKADVHARDSGTRKTALHLASHKGHVDVASALLEFKADVNSDDRFGMTPLQYASERGHLNVVHALLESKAHVDTKTESGRVGSAGRDLTRQPIWRRHASYI